MLVFGSVTLFNAVVFKPLFLDKLKELTPEFVGGFTPDIALTIPIAEVNTLPGGFVG